MLIFIHQTSKWMIQSIKNLRPDYKTRGEHKLTLLEVGAINNQLLRCPWLNVTALDLNSQHPYIEEMDYFDLTPEPIYDFIVASMVYTLCSSIVCCAVLSYCIVWPLSMPYSLSRSPTPYAPHPVLPY